MLVVYGLLGRKVKSVGQRPLPSRQKIIHDVSNIFNINQSINQSINQTSKEIRGAVVVVIVWWLDFQLPVPVQSVPITTNVVSSNLVHGEVYSIQHYVIKFASDLRQVCGSLGTLVSSTNKTDRHDITEILLKVALNTINQTNQPI